LPAPSVRVPQTEFHSRSTRHAQVVAGLGDVEVRLQKLVAELVMMRLFDEFQEAISGVAMRLACGTPYADGTQPTLLTAAARSVTSARLLYATFGRPRPQAPKWSKATFINDTTRYVLAPSEPFTVVCTANGGVISDMQAVRNRIAHSNKKSRAAFAGVVRRRYGANLNHVTPGTLLLSPRFQPLIIDEYLIACRAIVRGCARA
jgi:hypothetical protein